MKKRFFLMMSLICMLLATATVSAATNDDTNASYTITLSDDKTELTISGKGDLTTLNGKKYYFVNTLPGALYAGPDNAYSGVNAGDAYDESKTYATRKDVYTEIENFADNHVKEVTRFYFTEAGAKKYYTRTQTSWGDTPEYSYTLVKAGDEINKTEWVDNATKTSYFTVSDDVYTRVEALTDITSSEENASKMERKELSDCNDVYVQNGTGYTKVNNNDVYDDTKTYYQHSYEYTALTLDALNAGGYLRYEGGIVDEIWNIISANNIATIKFVNEGTEPFVIDNNIASALLYYNKNGWQTNTALKTLDMGAVTLKDFSQTSFANKFNYNAAQVVNVIIPLAEADENGGIIVPGNALLGLNIAATNSSIKSVVIPEGYTKIAANAFYEGKLTSVEFPSTLKEIGESAFSGCWGITEAKFNEGLETIGGYAFSNCAGLAEISFPSTLKTIGDMAFSSCKAYTKVKLNEGLEFIGNSAFGLQQATEQEVLEIPSTVKYMGPGCFHFRRYKDVYYYCETAPLSPLGTVLISPDYAPEAAFEGSVLFGNSGFTAQKVGTSGVPQNGTANRENYQNGTYFGVLHFRSDITDDQAETFTDITRVYQTWNGEDGSWAGYGASKEFGKEASQLVFHAGKNSTTDNNSGKKIAPGYVDTDHGSQKIWPSQSQWLRSYVNNSIGLKFDGVTEYAPELSAEQIALLRAQGFTEDATYIDPATGNEVTGYTVEALKKIAYLGTRQFVLVSRDVKGNPGEVDPGITDGGRWWTLCVPCDVRKSEVDRVFGKDSYLCLFSKVERESTKGGAENVIHLYFQNDTYQRQYTRQNDGTWKVDGAYTDDDPVVLYAHTPYMIYPKNRKDDGHDFILKNYEIKSGDVLRSKVVATDNTEYVYTSTYLDKTAEGSGVTIPQYSYAFGTTKTNKTPQFWFYTGTNGAWKSYKCLVQRYDENGSEDFASFFKGNVNNARQFSTFGQDSEVTGVDKVIIHIGEGENEAIYSIDGTLVSKSGDTSSLTKGVYIKNGKKFLVK